MKSPGHLPGAFHFITLILLFRITALQCRCAKLALFLPFDFSLYKVPFFEFLLLISEEFFDGVTCRFLVDSFSGDRYLIAIA